MKCSFIQIPFYFSIKNIDFTTWFTNVIILYALTKTLLTDTKLIDPNLDYVIHLNTLKVHFFFGEENFLDLLGRVSRIS